MPRVENKRTYKGPGVYIGRPSVWGNPYSHLATSQARWKASTRQQAVDLFEKYAIVRLQQQPQWLEPLRNAEALICWCAPQACHGDVIVKLLGMSQSAT